MWTPFVPLPVIVKVPPAIKVARGSRFPLFSAPVEKVTVPRLLPVIFPSLIRVELLRVNPAVFPLRVPPDVCEFYRACEHRHYSVSASKNNLTILFITTFHQDPMNCRFSLLRSPLPQAEAQLPDSILSQPELNRLSL